MSTATGHPLREQIELPLDPVEELASRLRVRVKGRCRLHLDMTLWRYHEAWLDLVTLHGEVCAGARLEITRLQAEARGLAGKQRRACREAVKQIEKLIRQARAVIEDHFLDANAPILRASERYHDADDEWFATTISEVRACEHLGHLTLRQIIAAEQPRKTP